jgi:hypothetical protein
MRDQLRQITIEDGLPSNIARAIVQTGTDWRDLTVGPLLRLAFAGRGLRRKASCRLWRRGHDGDLWVGIQFGLARISVMAPDDFGRSPPRFYLQGEAKRDAIASL